ncbi:phage portal protein [Aquibaculum sediminis]|uniref:phage portal protein n=1 Tax=Aquibaculum sediminis TaxID=3231907 RepID=UPI003455CE82
MNFVQKLAAQVFRIDQPMSPSDRDSFLRVGGGMESSSGAVVNDQTAMKVAVFWRCVSLISGAVANLPLDLIERRADDVRAPATGHPLRRVLTVKPNHWQTPAEFRKYLQTSVLMRGNGYALIVRTGNAVQALIPIHPDRVTVEQGDNLSLTYRVTTKDGSTRQFPQRDVLHLRGLSLDGFTGLSVISYMREALGLSLKGEEATARLFKQGNLAGGYFTHPDKLSQDAYQRLRASLVERAGSGQAHKWDILEEGMKPEPLKMNAQDQQFIELRDLQKYDIATFMGVPPHLVGLLDKTTSWGSGIEQQSIGFVIYTLNDWIKTWEETLKRDLLQEAQWETHDFRFYVQGLMRGDSGARANYYAQALQYRWMNPNEVRALEDMAPYSGGDTFLDPPNTAGTPVGGNDES